MQISEAAGGLEGGGCCYRGNRFPAEIINHACVSAAGRDPTHKPAQVAHSACLFALMAGSRSAPIGTPPSDDSNRRIKKIDRNHAGSRFDASHCRAISAGSGDVIERILGSDELILMLAEPPAGFRPGTPLPNAQPSSALCS